jgi:type I restriction enzyme M protein
LFIDARKFGITVDRTHPELTDREIWKIANTYHAWRGDHSRSPFADGGEGQGEGSYKDIPGFCRAAILEDIRNHSYVLALGRYVGAGQIEDDDEPSEEKMARLTRTLEAQFTESAQLERTIRENLRMLGV